MKLDVRIMFIAGALTLGACSGNFSSGTGMPQTGPGMPPMTSPLPANGPNGLPQGEANGSPLPSPSPAAPGTYAISQAQSGFQCPVTTDGYDCVLKFNLPAPTPTPKPGAKHSPSPTPSPTPTPTPTPTPLPSGATPSPTPTPASIVLRADAQPKSAPAMYHTPPNTLDVVPLMMVTLSTNADFPLNGYASAQFTLPKAQLEQRGFAVQLFQETSAHKKTTYTPIWTFDKSVLNDNTLKFDFLPPKTTIAKGSTYVLVLYGDDKSKQPANPSPGGSASPAASASPSSAPSATPSASPGDDLTGE